MLERMEFGETGPGPYPGYEWKRAVAHGALDPDAAANAGIADLDLAPRGAHGAVRYDADVRILRPRDGGNRRLLVVVPNRGTTGAVPFSVGTDPLAAGEPPDQGDGLLLSRGWTIAWVGWQWDVLPGDDRLGLRAPVAEVEPGWLRLEFRPDAPMASHSLSDSTEFASFADIPTWDEQDPDAVLTWRTTPHGPGTVVPRERWRFTAPATVELDGGFQPFHWYTLRYRSTFAPVVGTGLLALRDVAASLRQGMDAAFAFGVSQSGRFLRQFLLEARNIDERGDRVFDGVFVHIAGARRGEFNSRYGQPSLTHPMTPAYGPPYPTSELLAEHRRILPAPKIVLTNSSAEYWRGDAGLVHQDARTGADLPEDDDARTFLLSGVDHVGPHPIKGQLPLENEPNPLDPMPLLRALFLRLEQWVCDGIEPPSSRVPRRDDGTAVTRDEVLRRFRSAALPDSAALPQQARVDDPTAPAWELSAAEPVTALVSQVDEDGNEIAGVRLPAVEAATAAYTGWNPRRNVPGLPDVLYEFVGSRLPLQSGRPAPDPTAARLLARAAAERLVAQGLLLPEDVDRTVQEAVAPPPV
ncbi:alpha/beta hydrolase domain-containing protein [Naasia sp. SYSU D00948]|uniref:alpha/beta hydrolase domain-containing protein n=1 Tax=Naasia sp. SYSU D00948 TaxID=2817379 RepID=UPI001B3139F8|nr:alpha/beta hydrolase domain-containing protein [Naasia sp. SYSU D00948]